MYLNRFYNNATCSESNSIQKVRGISDMDLLKRRSANTTYIHALLSSTGINPNAMQSVRSIENELSS
jgi:hypothetical protein